MSDDPAEMRPPNPSSSPREVRAYVSDVLAQLADMARSLGDARLEYGLRLLALDAATPPR